MLTTPQLPPPLPAQDTAMAIVPPGYSKSHTPKPLVFIAMADIDKSLQANSPKQAASLPNSSSVLGQLYQRQSDSPFLNIPSMAASPSINGLYQMSHDSLKSQIPQAISAPVTPTNTGFAQPPRKGKGNQNGTNVIENKPAGSKSNSNLAHIPCKFFKNAACTAGKNCVFSHDKSSSADSYVCKYFLKGNCKFANKCALSHTLPTDRKPNGRSIKNGINGQRGGINIPEIRSPSMLPQGYGHDLNDFQSVNSPNGSFTRIPLSPTSEYASNRHFSQLTASLNDNPFPEEVHDQRMRNFSPTFGDHLTAPIQIHNHRRSLPDIFQHPNVEHFPHSPFHPHSASKALFSPSVPLFGSDNGMISPTSNAPQLQSIPELHGFQDRDDGVGEDLLFDCEEVCLPSSLNELFTAQEREKIRRRSRQEDVDRHILNPVPLRPHDSQQLLFAKNNVDPSHIHPYAGRSLPHGVSMGLAASNYLNHPIIDGQNLSHGYPTFGISGPARHPVSPINHTFDGLNDQYVDGNHLHPQNPYIPMNQPTHPRSASFSTFPNDLRNVTPAINIPQPHDIHPVDLNTPMYFNFDHKPTSSHGRPLTPADPFSPFEDDPPFYMDDEKNEQVSSAMPKDPGTPKTPLSYSAITKAGLKDSGATPGLSIDSRRFEPVC